MAVPEAYGNSTHPNREVIHLSCLPRTAPFMMAMRADFPQGYLFSGTSPPNNSAPGVSTFSLLGCPFRNTTVREWSIARGTYTLFAHLGAFSFVPRCGESVEPAPVAQTLVFAAPRLVSVLLSCL